MSSSSSSTASSASSTPAAPPASFFIPGPTGAVPRPHASSETLGTSSAGAAFDKRSERRRSTLSGSDRKRRLINFEGDGWPHRTGSHRMMEAGSSSRVAVDSRSIQPAPSHAAATPAVPGSSFATPIELSSSPPQLLPERTDNMHRTSWSQGANGYMEYIRPRWQPDSEVTNCPICGTTFSFWYRKHHCRKCGRVVCAACSPHRITIPRQFIVRPPEPNRSPAATLIPARAAQVINLHGDDTSQSPVAINPALGGGEEVRLCNPCVPDPNPEPLRGYTAVRGGGEQGTNWGRGPPSQGRHRSYHSLSTSTRQFPYDAFVSFVNSRGRELNTDKISPFQTESSSSRLNRRSISSNDYTGLGGALGGVFSSSLQERPMRYGSLPGSQCSNRHASSSARPYLGYFPALRHLPPPAPEGTSVSTGGSFSTTGHDRDSHRRVFYPPRRHVDESDICPICSDELPPLGENGNEDDREAHIRECIESHGRGTRSASRGGSPVAASPVPVRMLAFTATEKDCLGQDGAVQECTICMEDYEVGQPLVRLECLCKFHKRCIVEWFERKKECPVHKVA
ncbi:phosphatidylinositol-3-phosphate-binding ubiquitin-protein ligase [Aspergillus novofumigatus IBT 16806]|uniref:RING-type E3 ubiquitin transferase n=1 Tax=Aspergillus novofumigatus (strain IBT 16806) TaxID=1392255 RepID=A0A2I1BYB7_ASPN1|nr:FYVE-domain-containing protein [Aspergillus novofumigatus IBT 16806]PKX90366.1 FYVE-domain-containing protein [Aspergillus novofumigatus IBT 16806]